MFGLGVSIMLSDMSLNVNRVGKVGMVYFFRVMIMRLE